MKGSLHTDELMHEVTHPDAGLRTERRISLVFLMEVSTYPNPLGHGSMSPPTPAWESCHGLVG